MMDKKKVGAILLTGVMLLGMATSVGAAIPQVGTGSEENPIQQVPITKHLEMAEGITVPNAIFEFEAKAITEGAPQATIQNITYGTSDVLAGLKDGIYCISKDSAIKFGEFAEGGVYTYKITEKKNTYQADEGNDTMRYCEDSYLLRVYVKAKADGSGTYISDVTAEKNSEIGDEGSKVGKIDFTNVYTKRGGSEVNPDPHSSSLWIKKKTEGTGADKKKDFTFSLVLEKSPTEEAGGELTYTGHYRDGENGMTGETVQVTTGRETTFQLHDGEALIIRDVPAGTRYVVTELGVEDGYIPSVQVIENGVKAPLVSGKDQDDLATAAAGTKNLLGEKQNEITFINTFQDIAVTGVFLNNLPFILLIVLAVSALGALAVVKRKRAARK